MYPTGMLKLYIDGCLFAEEGSTVYPTSYTYRTTVMGQFLTNNQGNAGVKIGGFEFWEQVFSAPEVMAVFIRDH